MNKRLKALSCALVAIFALTIAVDSPKIGPFGVDAVSAATGVVSTPVKTPTKTPSKTSTSTTSYTTLSDTTKFTRLLKSGSVGDDVKLLQIRLSSYGYTLVYDGIYGNATLLAVKDFQSKHGFKADGIASLPTLVRLTPKVIVKTVPTSTVKLGSTGGDVKLVQSRLTSYGYKLYADGIFGNVTLVAVKNFQSKHSLKADGIVGPLTIAKLFVKAVVKPPVKPVTPPVKPPVVVVPPVVDVVTTASLVNTAAAFEKALGTKETGGTWIIASLKDLVSTKDLVLQGAFTEPDESVPPVQVAVGRKIALYAQDDKHVTTASYTLTAPKLTIKAGPKASIQKGTFKGDLYVQAQDFSLKTATIVGDVYVSGTGFKLTASSKIQGNVYFTNQIAKDTFDMTDTTCSVTGTKDLKVSIATDAVSSASLVDSTDKFEKALSADGTWIICPLKDMEIDKDLVLDGTFKKTGTETIQRKIGLYAHEGPVTNARFTLKAKSLTIKSPNASLQMGTFIGDVYVAETGFTMKETTIEGNLYFATQALLDAYNLKPDTLGSISGGAPTVKTK